MSKKTVLDQDADIYRIKKKKTEKEKLKDMTFKKKISYLWGYYKLHAFVFLLIMAVLLYTVYSFTKPKVETSLYVAIVNSTVDSSAFDEVNEDIATYLDLDPETQKVFLNPNFNFRAGGNYEINTRAALITYVAASEIDIIIAPESEFTNYTMNGFFHDLTEQLPTYLYTSLTKDFYVSDTDLEPELKAYGIYLDNAKYFNKPSLDGERYILGFLVNSPNRNNSIDFIEYMFENN